MGESAIDLSFVRLAKIEERISGSETSALRARWEFGHEILRYANEKGHLPRRFVKELSDDLGVQPAEVNRRKRFAQFYPTEAELDHAVIEFGSWHEVVSRGLGVEQEPQKFSQAEILEGTYRTIVSDPPWQYGNTSTRGAAEDHYPTMTIEELCAIPVESWAHDEAHLYLWTTNGFLREAFDVMDAWGFSYKTTLTWVKPQLGMGNYFRSSTEHVLFGIRGGMRTLDCNQFNWFEAKRGRHSKKPGMFFDLVEKCSPGPFLEMFAREHPLDRQHWNVWGNEV
jgi:N6-adenosine-specific RNA methylase IME4